MSPTPALATLPSLLERAQAIHGEDPHGAASTLRDGISLVPDAKGEEAVALVRQLEHVMLAHLCDVDGLGECLRVVAASTNPDDITLATALDRARFAATLLTDAAAPPPTDLTSADQVRAMSNAAAGNARRSRWAEVALLVQRAAALGDGDDVSGRAYAAMTNNLAGDLRTMPAERVRTDAELQRAMLDAAARARAAWARVGGWVEAERAEYQLALCHAAAGEGRQAVLHAQACLQGCLDHGADAFERFFAHEALVHAHVAAREGTPAHDALLAMRECLAQVDDAESRAWGETTLRDAERLLAA
jgi:hypothetical protein